MGKETGISWTDHTFNPWWGCTKVSPGCDNCYAETFSERPIHKLADGSKGALHIWGKGEPRRTFGDKHWNEPLTWNHAAFKDCAYRKVFCASMADIMDDEAPEGARERLWKLIDSTPSLMWLLLTKRPHRFTKYMPERFAHRNVWLGITAEDQERFDIRYPLLASFAEMREDIAHTFISYEPAIGPLDLTGLEFPFPDWIIFGGESGDGRRECKQEWAEQILGQCDLYDIKFFMKQMGGRTPNDGKAAIPAHLLIQEFPS